MEKAHGEEQSEAAQDQEQRERLMGADLVHETHDETRDEAARGAGHQDPGREIQTETDGRGLHTGRSQEGREEWPEERQHISKKGDQSNKKVGNNSRNNGR